MNNQEKDYDDDLGVFVLNDHCDEIEDAIYSLFKCASFSIFISGFIWLGVYLMNK